MGFLLVEIVVLLALAALFGAALMRWWLKRQFEDVTVEYSRLTTAESERSAALTAAHAAQSDAEKKLAALQGAHDGLRERLDAEAAWRAEVDRRLDALKPGDTSEVTARLKALDERIGALKPVDLDPALARLGELEKLFKSLRPNELNVVIARLDDLEQAVASIKPSDMDPLLAKLDALARRVERLAPTSASAPTSAPAPALDLAPVLARLDAIEGRTAALATLDLVALSAQLRAFVERPAPPDAPAAAVDLTPLGSRLDAIEARLGALGDPDKTPCAARLTSVQASLAAQRPVNLDGLDARLAALALMVSAIKPADPAPALARLEAGLGELTDRVSRPPPPSPQMLFLLHRRADGSRNLLSRPVFGAPDDLKRIVGVGVVLEKLLHDLGVYYFWQMAEWDDADVEFVDARLDAFKGRIERDHWVSQAREFAAEPEAARRPAFEEA
jgi:hypothetical protein